MKKLGKGSSFRAVAVALAVSGVLTLLASSGLFASANLAASDAWYQRGGVTDGEIVIIGIDQQALEEIGPYNQWGRDVIGTVLDIINESEDCHPAAIGIDVLFAGGSDPESDAYLTEAAGRFGNVATACAAAFGDAVVSDGDGGYYLDDYAVTGFDEPFDALKAVTDQGCINAMMDTDGVLRHHMLELNLPDGRTVPSLPLAMALRCQAETGYPEIIVRPPTDGHNFWYMTFAGGPGTYEEISVAQVLSGDVPAEYFAGKLVFIGPYAVGLQDSFITGADHAQQMYGVEYQANALQNLLTGEYRREVRDGLQYIILFAILALSIAGFWRRPMKVSTVLWLVIGLGWLALCRGMFSAGWVLHVLWVPLGVTVLYAGCIALNYIQAALERRQVTNTFKHYVAPEIVNELLQEGAAALELGGKMTNIAVLFVDVRGFTTMSEMLEPPQVVEILNRYLTLIADCILRNRGTLDKFVGDAAMAFWGAPLPMDDYIMQAVRAAWDMVKGSEALSAELMERYGRTVSFGIGVHVGDAVVGNIGSPERMDYTAIGDTVNTSARLEANAPAGTIYISRAVADALEGRIRTTSLGTSIKLKGKKDGFEILTMDEIIG